MLEIINRTTDYLARQGIASPRLQIESLLAHVLSLPRMQLYLQFDRTLTPAELDLLRPLVKRRAQGEPLQHIIGHTGFLNLTLHCGPQALVPRPETEMLVELTADTLRPRPPGHLADVGTGTGAIALALALALPEWRISATDISPEALALARRNQADHPATARVEFHEADLLDSLTPDAVVANLPYLTDEEMNHLPSEVRHDPPLALRGGPDGLDPLRRLLATLPASVQHLFLELGPLHIEKAAELVAASGFPPPEIIPDLTQRPRFLRARKNNPPSTNHLVSPSPSPILN